MQDIGYDQGIGHAPRQAGGLPYYANPASGLNGEPWPSNGDSDSIPSDLQVTSDNNGSSADVGIEPTFATFSAVSADWNPMRALTQQMPCPTPTLPSTIHTWRQRSATPLQNGLQQSSYAGAYQSPPVTDRMIEEAGTSEDPTWIMQNVQTLDFPPNATPPRSQQSPSSQSGGQHLCPHPNCCKTFDTRSELSHHHRNHVASEDRPHVCQLCSLEYLWPKDLNRHLKSQSHRRKAQSNTTQESSAGETFYCPVIHCKFHQRGFPRRDNCVRHIQTHKGFKNAAPLVSNALPSDVSSLSQTLA